jgi:hypothetical protein
VKSGGGGDGHSSNLDEKSSTGPFYESRSTPEVWLHRVEKVFHSDLNLRYHIPKLGARWLEATGRTKVSSAFCLHFRPTPAEVPFQNSVIA